MFFNFNVDRGGWMVRRQPPRLDCDEPPRLGKAGERMRIAMFALDFDNLVCGSNFQKDCIFSKVKIASFA
jgi:hypothetical protein